MVLLSRLPCPWLLHPLVQDGSMPSNGNLLENLIVPWP
jgi:hypothetical protein